MSVRTDEAIFKKLTFLARLPTRSSFGNCYKIFLKYTLTLIASLELRAACSLKPLDSSLQKARSGMDVVDQVVCGVAIS